MTKITQFLIKTGSENYKVIRAVTNNCVEISTIAIMKIGETENVFFFLMNIT